MEEEDEAAPNDTTETASSVMKDYETYNSSQPYTLPPTSEEESEYGEEESDDEDAVYFDPINGSIHRSRAAAQAYNEKLRARLGIVPKLVKEEEVKEAPKEVPKKEVPEEEDKEEEVKEEAKEEAKEEKVTMADGMSLVSGSRSDSGTVTVGVAAKIASAVSDCRERRRRGGGNFYNCQIPTSH